MTKIGKTEILQSTEKYFKQTLLLSLIFYLFKTAFWPLTYLFVISYLILLVIYFSRIAYGLDLKNYILTYLPPLLLCIIFFLSSTINAHYREEIIRKDLFRLIILLSYFYFYHWANTFLPQKLPVSFVEKIIIYITITISLVNLVKHLAFSIIPSDFLSTLNISEDMALTFDYNFFSLFLILGLIVINWNRTRTMNLGFSNFSIIVIDIIVIINIILSGSRRGIFAFSILLLVYFLYNVFLNTRTLKNALLIIAKIMVTIIVVAVIGILILNSSSQDKITNSVLHYGSLFGLNDKMKIEQLLWKNKLKKSIKGNYIIDKDFFKHNPGYWIPMSADGTSLSYIMTPYGKGVKVYRGESPHHGGVSLFYCGPEILYYANHTYKISFKIKLLHGDFNSFSVGWYLAEGDGGKDLSYILSLNKNIEQLEDGWCSLTSYYTFIDNQIGPSGFINSVISNTEFIIADFELVDLDYSPEFPKFQLELDINNDQYIYLNEINKPLLSETNLLVNGDFSHGLKYWNCNADSVEIKVVKINNRNAAYIKRGSGNGDFWSLFYIGRDVNFKSGDLYRIGFKVKPVVPDKIPFIIGYGIDEKSGSTHAWNLNYSVDTLNNGWLQLYATYRFGSSYSNLIYPIHYQLNNSEFYITDIELTNLDDSSVYSSNKKTIQTSPLIENGSDKFYSDRKSRLLFALDIFRNKYTLFQKTFGHGFGFMRLFGEKYNNNMPDWPHNPFISVLLYSGFVGLFLYFWLLYLVVRLYLKYWDQNKILFICFLVTFFFSFFSGGSPFDPPIMGFFTLLPFFIHSIHKNDNTKQELNTINE